MHCARSCLWRLIILSTILPDSRILFNLYLSDKDSIFKVASFMKLRFELQSTTRMFPVAISTPIPQS